MMERSTRRNIILGLAGVTALSVWKGKTLIMPLVNVLAANSDWVADRLGRLETRRILSARGYVSGVAWSRDGGRIAAISDFGRWVTVWKADGTRLAEFNRLGTYVDNSIAFLSDELVLTAVSDATQAEEGLLFT